MVIDNYSCKNKIFEFDFIILEILSFSLSAKVFASEKGVFIPTIKIPGPLFSKTLPMESFMYFFKMHLINSILNI